METARGRADGWAPCIRRKKSKRVRGVRGVRGVESVESGLDELCSSTGSPGVRGVQSGLTVQAAASDALAVRDDGLEDVAAATRALGDVAGDFARFLILRSSLVRRVPRAVGCEARDVSRGLAFTLVDLED